MDNPPNQIEIIGLKNETINFGNLLSKNNSLIIKNCFDVKIILKSKINKITIEKSNKIYLCVHKLINGVELSNSKFILLSSENSEDPTKTIPFLDIYKSSVYLVGSLDFYSSIKINCSLSELYHLEL
jgi:hypothetical protein